MTVATLSPDFAVIKQRQQATWAAGDYAVIGHRHHTSDRR